MKSEVEQDLFILSREVSEIVWGLEENLSLLLGSVVSAIAPGAIAYDLVLYTPFHIFIYILNL